MRTGAQTEDAPRRNLLEGLSPSTALQLRKEADRLLGLLPEGKWTEKVAAAKEAYLPPPESGQVAPVTGAPRLSKDEFPLASFLATSPLDDHARRQDLDLLRGFALAAALRFIAGSRASDGRDADDRYPTVKAGLRAIRRLASYRLFDTMRGELPAIPRNISELLDVLGDWHERLSQRHDSFAARVDEMRRLLQHLPAFRGTREISSPDERETGHRRMPTYAWAIRTLPADDFSAPPILLFRAPPQDLEPEDYPRGPEEAADLAATERADLGFVDRTEDELTDEFSGQLELLEREDRKFAWLADHGSLTNEDCARIMRAASRALLTPSPARGAVLCAASLFLGRSMDDLILLAWVEAAPGRSWWRDDGVAFVPDVTNARNENGLHLQIPEPWRKPFRDVLALRGNDLGTWQKEAAAWLAGLDLPRPVRLGSLARALPDGLASRGEDQALIGMLTGRSVTEMTQLYYASFPIARLNAAWVEHQHARLGLSAKSCGAATRIGRGQYVGSRLVPSDRDVRLFFEQLRQNWQDSENLLRRDASEHWPDLHAAITNYCLAALSLVTARRPFGAAFEPFSRISGRKRVRVLVSDKGNRINDDARWLPLPPSAVRILEIYRQSLQRLLDDIETLIPDETIFHIKDVQNGAQPSFFVWPSLKELPEPLSAAAFWDRIDLPARKPRNWCRHYMRRSLAEMGMPGHRIDSYMGHGGSWSDALLPSSMDSLADQDGLSAALEQILLRSIGELPGAEPRPWP